MSAPAEGRSLPWFRVDVDLVDHPKVDALCDRLGDPLAGWYVIRLWAWTMRYAARGRLAPGARLSVERACGWRGESGALWAALLDTGWIEPADADGHLVHDWAEHNGAAVAKAEKDAERKREARAARARRGDGARRSVDAGADRRADAAGNGTERNGTRKTSAPAAPTPPRESDALCDDFKAAIGSPYRWQGVKDGKAFAELRKIASLDEVRTRWRRGLALPADEWLSCRTVAQLAAKWNDLADAKAPPRVSIEHQPSRML